MNKLLNKLIEIGHELEGVEYNSKFEGYEGFDKETRRKQRRNLRAKAKRIIKKLNDEGINPYMKNYTYTDENGIEWELDYAMQFI